ncbi:MAG: asparagine synthase (glutamine-hydrolyzing), partial [Nitrospinaceae bacterium]
MAASLQRMGSTLTHRGPDDEGQWHDSRAGVGLAHQRLSIIDLSSQGRQPMMSPSGRYVIVYNGEIYNFPALRKELDDLAAMEPATASFSWRGHSDTEVLLAAIEQWGLKKALKKFIGMFAFALWDRRERVLHLVRDRLGIKPLYYGWQGRAFLFGSELKALKAHPEFQGQIDRNALALMMRHNYIPAPHSIYKNIYKLLPGTILTIDKGGVHSRPKPVPYWCAREAAEKGVASPFTGSTEEAAEQLDGLLRDATKLRMISDVPLGAFLSGGIDSSAVVALMQAQSSRPVKTFSIGFHEEKYNEAGHAKRVAQYLGTDHTELYVTPEQAMGVIPCLPALYDEPFSDSSQIPTFLVSRLARGHVTVSLSGDGGDELFAGYNRYFWAGKIWKYLKWVPPGSGKIIANALMAVSRCTGVRAPGLFINFIPGKYRYKNICEKIQRLAKILEDGSPEYLYFNLISHWQDPGSIVIDGQDHAGILEKIRNGTGNYEFFQFMMFLDTVTYLPDDILTKVDRASMGAGLEARVPLLDHRVV